MIFMLICTEGDVSEPALIKAVTSTIGGQAPLSISRSIDILPLPLGGNHGHKKLIQTANEVIDRHSKDELFGLASEGDTIEKWIVVDHDDMESHRVDPEQLRQEAKDAGYDLIISKPNFEFFVLATLSDLSTAEATNKDQIMSQINLHIQRLNAIDRDERGFSKEVLMPDAYSKKKHYAEKLFGLMIGHHPELIEKMASLETYTTSEKYSEMPRIITRIVELYRQA